MNDQMKKDKKDWWDTHIKVVGYENNRKKEKQIHSSIKKACIEYWMQQASKITELENAREKRKND